MAIHNVSKRDWPRLTWKYPRIHNYEFGFGLSAESTNQASTMVPYFFQNNALVDYETICKSKGSRVCRFTTEY